MTEVEQRELIDTLTHSYNQQLVQYRELARVGEKILSKVVLSRGDVSSVMGLFAQKKTILEAISQERMQTRDAADAWRKIKSSSGQTVSAERLDQLLEEVECAIRLFLDNETQIGAYLEHIMQQSPQQEHR